MSSQPRSFFFNVDWVTILFYLALCTIGLFNIHSAVFDVKNEGLLDLDANYGKQFIFIISSIIIAIVILLLESRFITALAPAIYVITIILLVLVFAK